MGKSKSNNVARSKFRKKMRAWGMDEAEIDECIINIKLRQKEKALGVIPMDSPLCTRAEYVKLLRKHTHVNNKPPALKLGEDYQTPSDAGYKPRYIDPVLTGVARATGETAKAVKRGKSVVKYDYDKEK